MGWAFWRKAEAPAEPERERAPAARRVTPLDRSDEIRRAAQLRQYILGRMNAPASMMALSVADLRAEVEKHRDAHWFTSAIGKLSELEVLES